MKTKLYLKSISPENLLATVDLEVVPRGIYVINGIPYQYTGQPKFTIVKGESPPFNTHMLILTELIVEPVT